MYDKSDGIVRIIVTILGFPLIFQDRFVGFTWGAADPFWLMFFKRLLLLLPALAIIFSCWVTIICLLSVLFRQDRRDFLNTLLVTWWDLGRAIFQFWGGLGKLCISLPLWLIGALRLIAVAILLTIKDIIMAPIRLLSDVSHGYSNPGVPWPAVFMMVAWAGLEALIFTYVMTPLVTDVLGGLAGGEIGRRTLQIPLFMFFVVVVLGSYAVLHAYGMALKEKKYSKMFSYTIIEIVTALFEVIFLYREFVDALEPWFAQHAGDDFKLGIGATLGIATMVWLGIRSMTWFLFGSTGVPTIMAMIQRTGIDSILGKSHDEKKKEDKRRYIFEYIHEAIDYIKKDMDWVVTKGDQLLCDFLVPWLQIVAASVNFCTLIIMNHHLFELPFRSITDILDARTLLMKSRKSLTGDKV